MLGYGIGDFGFNLYWSTLSLFVLYYYTDVIGIPARTAGLIILIALVWDGITDPLMGYLAERTRTRWGSYRPYLLFGGPPLAASLMLMFYKPDMAGAALVLYAAVTHLVLRTTYTIMSIPYGALSARMTSNSAERNWLAACRMVCATSAALFASFFTLRLANQFGGGDQAVGFFWVAVLFALLSLPLFLIVFASTDESGPGPGSAGAPPATETERPTIGRIVGSMARNPAFLIVTAAVLLGILGGTFSMKTLIYYFKYNLGNAEAAGTALAVVTGGMVLLVPVWAAIATRTNKRTVWLAGLAIGIAANLMLYLNPVQTPGMVTLLFALVAVGSAPGALCIWSTLPDTVELGEWRSGVRTESTLFGAMQLMLKVGSGLGAAMLGFMLDGIGFQANVDQAPETMAGIKVIMTLLPAGLGVVGLVLIYFYPLDQRTHARLVRALAWRRKRRAARSVP